MRRLGRRLRLGADIRQVLRVDARRTKDAQWKGTNIEDSRAERRSNDTLTPAGLLFPPTMFVHVCLSVCPTD